MRIFASYLWIVGGLSLMALWEARYGDRLPLGWRAAAVIGFPVFALIILFVTLNDFRNSLRDEWAGCETDELE